MAVSLGMMTTPITISSKTVTTDAEGFASETLVKVLDAKAYREQRQATEIWRNRAEFCSATDMFIIRKPSAAIKTDMVIECGGELFEIRSIDALKGRGMYLQILAEEVVPSGEV